MKKKSNSLTCRGVKVLSVLKKKKKSQKAQKKKRISNTCHRKKPWVCCWWHWPVLRVAMPANRAKSTTVNITFIRRKPARWLPAAKRSSVANVSVQSPYHVLLSMHSSLVWNWCWTEVIAFNSRRSQFSPKPALSSTNYPKSIWNQSSIKNYHQIGKQ